MKRKRIGVLTAGGNTPALNAVIYGIVEEANRRETEVAGLIRRCASLVGDMRPASRPAAKFLVAKQPLQRNFPILRAG